MKDPRSKSSVRSAALGATLSVVLSLAANAQNANVQTVPVSRPVDGLRTLPQLSSMPSSGGRPDVSATVAAATANAIDSLRRDIFATRVLYRTSVEDFLRQTGTENEMSLVIRGAQQIGPPRWIDDQTCQVKLELSGSRVARTLVSMANNYRGKAPVSADLLSRELRDWQYRSFTATGSASGSDQVFSAKPNDAAGNAWQGVDEASRKAAIAAAKQNITGKILESIKPVELAPGKTVADALAIPAVKQKVVDWINSRPVTSVQFQSDRSVVLTLAAPSDGLAQTLTYALAEQKSPDASAIDLSRLQRNLAVRMVEPTGGSQVSATGAAAAIAAAPADFRLPATPPDWVYRSVDAEGTAPFAGNRLLTGRAGEEKATENIRAKIYALQLDDKRTIGQAAKADPSVERALSRSMLRARVLKVDYQPDGGVVVKMNLDARVIWDELNGGS